MRWTLVPGNGGGLVVGEIQRGREQENVLAGPSIRELYSKPEGTPDAVHRASNEALPIELRSPQGVNYKSRLRLLTSLAFLASS